MRSTARCLAAASCVAVLLPWHGHGAEPAQPSLTKFGPCFKIDGSVELVWMRSFLGPTGAIGWFHGSEIVIREVTPGSPAEGLLKEGDVIIAADGHELGPDPRVGMGSWSCGYTAIYLAEYYMVTGDRTVLPELDRLCREIAKGQAPSGTWGHSAGYSRSYAVGGMVNMCGITNWLGMFIRCEG